MIKKTPQHRHYICAKLNFAHMIYQLLDNEFEEDGFPISMYEIDEINNTWGVAIYANAACSLSIKARFHYVLSQNNIDPDIQTEIITQSDWVNQTLSQLKPVRSGRFLVHGSHDRDAPKFNDIAIEIDAGQAFGTGQHGTTAGSLDMLDRELKKQKILNPLDLGTGSGVLAIAIAKAIKRNVLASDIDPIATQVAHENAAKNGVGKYITSICANGFNHRTISSNAPYDLIIANILARPLQALAPDFARHAAPSATIILSGLLPHQKARITSAFTLQAMRLVRAHIRDGWLTLVLKAQ